MPPPPPPTTPDDAPSPPLLSNPVHNPLRPPPPAPAPILELLLLTPPDCALLAFLEGDLWSDACLQPLLRLWNRGPAAGLHTIELTVKTAIIHSKALIGHLATEKQIIRYT